MGRRSPERVSPEPLGLHIRPPKNEPHVDTTGGSTIKNIKCAPPPIRHLEGWPHESHCDPNAESGGLDCLAYATERRFTVNQRPHKIPAAPRIGTGLHEGNDTTAHGHSRLGHINLNTPAAT